MLLAVDASEIAANLLESEGLVRAATFLLALGAIYAVGTLFVEPALIRVIRVRNRRNPTIQSAMARYVRVAIVVVAVSVATVAAGYGHVITGSAVIVAAATVAIGVAGQEVIGNLISGLFLVADQEFNVGDWIVWEGHEGRIEAIALRVTRIRTGDNEVITVPNTAFSTAAVTRPYGRGRFRVRMSFDVAYDDDVDEASDVLLETARDADAVLDSPAPAVELVEFTDSAVVLEVRYWIESPTRESVRRLRSSYAHRVKERFDAAGITLGPASSHDLAGRVAVDLAGEADDGRPAHD